MVNHYKLQVFLLNGCYLVTYLVSLFFSSLYLKLKSLHFALRERVETFELSNILKKNSPLLLQNCVEGLGAHCIQSKRFHPEKRKRKENCHVQDFVQSDRLRYEEERMVKVNKALYTRLGSPPPAIAFFCWRVYSAVLWWARDQCYFSDLISCTGHASTLTLRHCQHGRNNYLSPYRLM